MKILEKIRSTDSLPSLPTVAIEVLSLTRRDDTTVQQLATVIQNDPGLTAKVLKVVNSPLFGIPREISSLKQAINMLGLRTVKVMALSFSLVETVGRAECDGFDFSAYWRRSLTTAVAARLIAKAACPEVAEEAFVAGLLADVGMVAAWRADSKTYTAVFEAWRESGSTLVAAETEKFGCSHALMSGELLRSWGLPAIVCDAVESHHEENLDKRSGNSLKLTHIAISAAQFAGLFGQDTPCRELFAVKETCCRNCGLTEAQLDDILSTMNRHVREAASMLNVQIGTTVQYAQLQAEAAMQLANLSMQAEMERAASEKRESAIRAEADRLTDEKRQILEVAATDGLTKVANRAAFDKQLDDAFQRAAQTNEALGLIMMDVDHFKKFNDTHGHQAGDEVLRMVGQCLKDVVRGNGFVARYGGEEFAVMLIGDTTRQIRELAESIRTAIESRTVTHANKALHVTASLGTAEVTGNAGSASPGLLVEAADKKLYEAKRAGRNRVE